MYYVAFGAVATGIVIYSGYALLHFPLIKFLFLLGGSFRIFLKLNDFRTDLPNSSMLSHKFNLCIKFQ